MSVRREGRGEDEAGREDEAESVRAGRKPSRWSHGVSCLWPGTEIDDAFSHRSEDS